jgi:hypothetical protein
VTTPVPAGSPAPKKPRKSTSKPRAKKPKTTTAPAVPAATAAVHETQESMATVTMTPPHPPREETPEYKAAHDFLIHQKKAACEVCGVTIDTLGDPKANPFGATAMESHHFPIERSLVDACDPAKVHADFPVVYDRRTLIVFVDSPANLKVLCDVHHRSPEHGIHHLTHADWTVQKYLYEGYLIAALVKDAAAALAQDEQIVRAAGIEQAVQDGTEAALEEQAQAAAQPDAA